MNRWVARLPILAELDKRRRAQRCAEAAARLQELVDGEIPSEAERAELQRHVEECPPCGAGADTIRELKEAIARVGSRPDPAVRARLGELMGARREGRCPPE